MPDVRVVAQPGGDSGGDIIKGLPLWEKVKVTIHDVWVSINQEKERIDDCLMGGYAVNDKDDRHFRAKVLTLYRHVRAKLDYNEDADCVKKLRRINLDQYHLNPGRFDRTTAAEAATLLGEFLELNGVTKYEDKSVDPDHSFIAELQ